jgi:hypothetical protein
MSMAAKERRLVAVPSAPQAVTAAEGGIRLARVVSRDGDRFRIRQGGGERLASCDASVDPALIETAIATGARVVVEDGPEPSIVGALATARSVLVDRDGGVRLSVERFEVTAEEALLKTRSAFLSLKGDEVEIFGRRILSRARELARILARAIQLD